MLIFMLMWSILKWEKRWSCVHDALGLFLRTYLSAKYEMARVRALTFLLSLCPGLHMGAVDVNEVIVQRLHAGKNIFVSTLMYIIPLLRGDYYTELRKSAVI